MAPPDGALIPGITRFVSTPSEIESAIKEMANQGVNQVSDLQNVILKD